MRRWAGRAAAAMSLLALGWATGCSGFFVYPGSSNGGGGATSTSDYAYVANATTSTLGGFSVGTGTLTAVSGSPFGLGFVPTAVAVNPANTIVFVAGSNGIDGFINAYSIGSGGALSLLKSNNVVSAGEVAMDVSPDGNWLVGLDSNGPTVNEAIVDEYQIASSGQLTLATGTSYTFPSGTPTIVPRAIKFSPGNGQYVFVALGTAGDVVFTFNTATGVFATSLVTLATGTTTQSDNSLAVTTINSNLYLYIARSNSQSPGAVLAYVVGAGGLPSYLGQAATGVQPDALVVNTAGTDVYVANRSDGTASEFSIASDGTPTVLSPTTYSSGLGSFPVALAVDKSGNYLLAIASGGSPDLTLYSYDTTAAGQLKFAASIASGNDPAGANAMAVTH